MTDEHRRRSAVVLLVEDDPAVQDLVRDALAAAGHRVWVAGSAAEADVLTDELRPDVILVDLALPDANGLLLCGDLKEKTGAAVVVCSGTKRQDDVALAFRLGADDFVGKPVRIHELRARVGAVLDRAGGRAVKPPDAGSAPRVLRAGAIVVDDGACRVSVDDATVPVTPTEYRLLRMLAAQPGRVVPRDELCRGVLGCDDRAARETLGVHARRLRAKLAAHAGPPRTIEAVRGFGYRLTAGTASGAGS